MKPGKLPFLLFFLLDACYMTFGIAAFSFFVFWSNNGRFRWYMAAGAAVGMALYLGTVGRVVMAFSEAIVRLMKRLLNRILVTPLRWILRMLCAGGAAVLRLTVCPILRGGRRAFASAHTNRIQKRLAREIRFPELTQPGNTQ